MFFFSSFPISRPTEADTDRRFSPSYHQSDIISSLTSCFLGDHPVHYRPLTPLFFFFFRSPFEPNKLFSFCLRVTVSPVVLNALKPILGIVPKCSHRTTTKQDRTSHPFALRVPGSSPLPPQKKYSTPVHSRKGERGAERHVGGG